MSYWIYQHLGNLSPDELAANDLYREIRAAADGESSLRAFAQAADREPDGGPGILWSYRRDFGRVRLLVIDSRCGRVLTEGHRQMVSDPEFDWIEAQVEDGDYDHLLVATSVPWLLPRALHDLEAADEGLTAGSRGRVVAKLAELLRRKVDLEHWAAFGASFERLAALFERIGRGDHGAPPPATIAVLSGDVHHTYVSEATLRRPVASRVYQLTCSPLAQQHPAADARGLQGRLERPRRTLRAGAAPVRARDPGLRHLEDVRRPVLRQSPGSPHVPRTGRDLRAPPSREVRCRAGDRADPGGEARPLGDPAAGRGRA